MRNLDREGLFKAHLLSWKVWDADSGAVAVSCEFRVGAQWNGADEWTDWSDYDEHRCFGNWWVVKKGGQINTSAVDQLARSLGWNGDLQGVLGPPPDRIVQISVKPEEYNGQTRFKASWMNPEDYEPQQQGASEEKVGNLQTRFGSLLRAAAAVSAAPAASSAAASPTADDDLPF